MDSQPVGAQSENKDEMDNRVNQLVDGKTEEDVKGLLDLQNMHLAIGLPSVRFVLTQLLEKTTHSFAEQKRIQSMIRDISPITETACFTVSYYNKELKSTRLAHLVLGECKRNHNLDDQINKIRHHLSNDEWLIIVRKLSELVSIGRMVFTQAVRKNIHILRTIMSYSEEEPCTQYLTLRVDPANTTMFVDEQWETRIGIYITLDSEA